MEPIQGPFGNIVKCSSGEIEGMKGIIDMAFCSPTSLSASFGMVSNRVESYRWVSCRSWPTLSCFLCCSIKMIWSMFSGRNGKFDMLVELVQAISLSSWSKLDTEIPIAMPPVWAGRILTLYSSLVFWRSSTRTELLRQTSTRRGESQKSNFFHGDCGILEQWEQIVIIFEAETHPVFLL